DSWGSDHLPIIIGKPPKAPLKTCHLVDWKEYRGQLDKLVDSGAPLAPENITEALKKATRMQLGHQFRFQWLPSHCAIKGKRDRRPDGQLRPR
ncbi:unnamed protein product, partial [Ixodes hexagonus]